MDAIDMSHHDSTLDRPDGSQTESSHDSKRNDIFSPQPVQGGDSGLLSGKWRETSSNASDSAVADSFNVVLERSQPGDSVSSLQQNVQDVVASTTELESDAKERLPLGNYRSLNDETRDGVTPDPRIRDVTLTSNSQKVYDHFGDDKTFSVRNNEATRSGQEGDQHASQMIMESQLANVFLNLNPEIRKVVTEIKNPVASSSTMGNRIQQLWLKAERTANSESQKQVLVNNKIKSAAQEAISIFETVEIPNTVSEIKQNQKGMQRAETSISAFSELTSPLDVDSNINLHPKSIDIKLEGLGSPQPVRSTLRKGTRSVPSKILFEARDGNSTSEQKVLSQIPDNIYSRCDQNLPEVQLGMFSNLTKSEAVMDTTSNNGYSDPTPIATKDGISMEREGSGSVRRRFLVRPGAESQEAIRKASDLCSESAYDRSTESGVSGSHTLKKIKPDTAKASNKASKDSSEDIPKRKRGRPPKKRRKGTQQQSQGHTTVHGQETIEVPKDKVAITLTTMANSLKNTNVSKTLQNSPRIAFSGIEPEEGLVSMLSGATVVHESEDATHLIFGGGERREVDAPYCGENLRKADADAPGRQVSLRRTPKLLLALNTGVQNVVCLQWLIDSAKAKKALPLNAADASANMAQKDHRPLTRGISQPKHPLSVAAQNALYYTIQDEDKERLYGFSMLDTLSRQKCGRRSSIFKSVAFYVTPSVLGVNAPEENEFSSIITSAGGLFLGDKALHQDITSVPPSWVSAMQQHKTLVVVVLSSPEAMKLSPCLPSWLRHVDETAGKMQALAGLVLSVEFLYVSVLRQNLALREAMDDMLLTRIPP